MAMTPQLFHTVPTSWQLCIPQNSLHALSLLICIEWTSYSALLTPQSYTYLPCPCSSNKISQHNLNSNIPPYRPSIVHTLHSFCIQSRCTMLICHAQYSNYIAATNNITHSLCTFKCTIYTHHSHPSAFHNPSLHTTNKHKAYLCKWWQNGTRCRDGVKVLWCHSHLVWLVLEASIPTCACFH